MILVFALAVLCVFIDVVASENQGQVLFVTNFDTGQEKDFVLFLTDAVA